MNNTAASTDTQYPAHQDSDTVSITHRIIGTHPGGRYIAQISFVN